MFWLLLIPYCTAVYGIHGGEGITGINRQVRNILCAAPFALALNGLFPLSAEIAFVLSYLGTNMGFTTHPLWFKGYTTFPPLGAALLPFAYWVGSKTKGNPAAFSEYFSGFLYGVTLFSIHTLL